MADTSALDQSSGIAPCSKVRSQEGGYLLGSFLDYPSGDLVWSSCANGVITSILSHPPSYYQYHPSLTMSFYLLHNLRSNVPLSMSRWGPPPPPPAHKVAQNKANVSIIAHNHILHWTLVPRQTHNVVSVSGHINGHEPVSCLSSSSILKQ